MSNFLASGSTASRGLLGAFKSWLRPPSGQSWPLSALLPGEKPLVHAYGTARVLVVDDNPVNLMLMAALMASRGLVPSMAADGAEAVALACEQDFDLILMDLQMPVLDGLGATAAIRRFEASHARSAVPVVAYSSTTLGAGVLASHGLNGSLSKPCSDQDLEHCLVQWCPSYRAAPATRGVAHSQR